jgi:hypothetical protein
VRTRVRAASFAMLRKKPDRCRNKIALSRKTHNNETHLEVRARHAEILLEPLAALRAHAQVVQRAGVLLRRRRFEQLHALSGRMAIMVEGKATMSMRTY